MLSVGTLSELKNCNVLNAGCDRVETLCTTVDPGSVTEAEVQKSQLCETSARPTTGGIARVAPLGSPNTGTSQAGLVAPECALCAWVAVPGSARGGRGAAQGEALTPVSPSAASADNAPLSECKTASRRAVDGYSARVFEECRRLEVRCLPSRVGRSFWTSALLCFARRRSSGSGVKFSDGDGAVVEGGPGGLACERTHAEDGNSFINEPGSATSPWQLRSTAAPTNVPRRKPPPPLAARAPRGQPPAARPAS
ncbi:unnamed protein product [Lampetra planeri]